MDMVFVSTSNTIEENASIAFFQSNGKPLRVFFSDVSVKLTGSDTWMNAQ